MEIAPGIRAVIVPGALAAPPADLARDLLVYTLAVKIYADGWATTGVLIDHVRAKVDLGDTFSTAVPDRVTAAEVTLDARERELLAWLEEDGRDLHGERMRG